MADGSPNIDDLLGPMPGAQTQSPSAAPAQDVDSLLGPMPTEQPPFWKRAISAVTGPLMDSHFNSAENPGGAGARILDAFRQGGQNYWGAGEFDLPQETVDFLKEANQYDAAKSDHESFFKRMSEAYMRSTAANMAMEQAGGAAIRRLPETIGAVAQGLGGAAVQAGRETRTETGEQIGQTAAGMLEYRMTSGDIANPATHLGGFGVTPEQLHAAYQNLPAQRIEPIPPEVVRGSELGTIGTTDAQWQGLDEAPPPTDDALAQAAKRQNEVAAQEPTIPGEAPTPVEGETLPAEQPAAPDIHSVARQIDPQTFQQFDALTQQQTTLRRWIDELRDTRDQGIKDQFDLQIADEQKKLDEGATGKRAATYRSRIADLTDQRDKVLADAQEKGDTPDMTRVRNDLAQTGYKMRDLAPDVTRAYQQAADQLGQRAPTEELGAPAPAEAATPGAPQAIAEQPAAAPGEAAGEQVPEAPQAPVPVPEATPASAPSPEGGIRAVPTPTGAIAGDVSKKLVGTGRPQEEADAAGAIVQAIYDTRAARFEGLKGTADDLYKDDATEIQGGEKGGPKGRAGGKIRIDQEGKKYITLFKKADASTFIHEVGHDMLDQLLFDADDKLAPQQLKDDAISVRDWLGADPDTGTITKGQHEKFARGFERYMMEGRSPSPALTGIFEKFRQWLTGIYQTVTKLRSPINDDIRDVFDRLITKEPVPRPVSAAESFLDHLGLGDKHTDLAATTPPELADTTRENIRAEADDFARKEVPEIADELGAGPGSGERPDLTGGAEAGGLPHGDGDAGQLEPAGAVGGEAVGTVGEGGSTASAQSPRGGIRTVPAEQPRAPNESYGLSQDTGLVDKAGNIRLDNVKAPEDAKQVLRDLAAQNNDFLNERRGIVPDSELFSFADALGVDPGMVNLKKLQALSYEDEIPLGARVLAGRIAMVQAANDARRLAAEASKDGATDADIAAYAAARERVSMFARGIAGVTAEWGRAGRGFRSLADWEQAQNVAAAIEQSTGRTLFQLRDEAKRIANLNTPAQTTAAIRTANLPAYQRLKVGLLSYFLNNLISGPITHLAYSASNHIWTLFKTGVNGSAAAAVGAFEEGVLGKTLDDRVRFADVAAGLHTMFAAPPDALAHAQQAFKSGIPYMRGMPNPVDALEMQSPLSEQPLGPRKIFAGSAPGSVLSKVGRALETPSRAVAAIHTMSYAVAFESDLMRRAVRQAVNAGLTGDEYAQSVADFQKNTPAAALQAAHDHAIKSVLMERPAFGTTQQDVQRIFNRFFLTKLMFPFVQIGMNLTKEGLLEQSPFAPFYSSEARADLRGDNGPVARQERAGRMIVGTAVTTGVMGLTSAGVLTGAGPTDEKARADLMRAGWRPFSVHVGGLYIPYAKWTGPLGLYIGASSVLHDAGASTLSDHDVAEGAHVLVSGMSDLLADQLWIGQVGEFFQALWSLKNKNPTQAKSYAENIANGFLPFSTMLNQTRQMIDPTRRRVNDWMSSVMNHIPGESSNLQPMIDWRGNAVTNPGFGETMVSPQVGKVDPTTQELARLDIGISRPGQDIKGAVLSPEEYTVYAKTRGATLAQELDRMVQMPYYRAAPDKMKKQLIAQKEAAATQSAENRVQMLFPHLIQDANKAKAALLQHR